MHKDELIHQLGKTSRDFDIFCKNIPDEYFFRQPADKWSIAQNVAHLVQSAKMTRLAYRLPKIIIRLYTGKPNRPSRGYEELVAKYKSKLEKGGKASGPFIPKPILPQSGKEKWLDQLAAIMDRMEKDIQNNWKDPQLDQYLAPHPLLGKITLRELAYFTIYHTKHHQAIIQARLNN